MSSPKSGPPDLSALAAAALRKHRRDCRKLVLKHRSLVCFYSNPVIPFEFSYHPHLKNLQSLTSFPREMRAAINLVSSGAQGRSSGTWMRPSSKGKEEGCFPVITCSNVAPTLPMYCSGGM